jgi:hypothetical protein
MKFITVIAALLSFNVMAKSPCIDENLKEIGFKFRKASQFLKDAKDMQQWLAQDDKDFVEDMDSPVWSAPYRGYVFMQSYDYLPTPQPEMFGDVIIFRDHFNREKIVEVRWYENGQKYISFDREEQACAIPLFPYADNALF